MPRSEVGSGIPSSPPRLTVAWLPVPLFVKNYVFFRAVNFDYRATVSAQPLKSVRIIVTIDRGSRSPLCAGTFWKIALPLCIKIFRVSSRGSDYSLMLELFVSSESRFVLELIANGKRSSCELRYRCDLGSVISVVY